MARIFGEKGKYKKYSLTEQQELGAKVKEFKQQYLSELEALEAKLTMIIKENVMYQINQNKVT